MSGKVLSIIGTMASTLGTYNPLRYRGYVYDQETDLYYVSSRYCSPQLDRWISPDSFISTGQGVFGTNMFAYCANNPVNRVDKTGERYEVIDPSAIGNYGGGSLLGGLGIIAAAKAMWDGFAEHIRNTLAVAERKNYRSDHETHHIVAKGSYKAEEARTILEELYTNGTEEPINKVSLKTGLHRRIHTDVYYAITNTLVTYAHKSANGDKVLARKRVNETLETIKKTLKGFEIFIRW